MTIAEFLQARIAEGMDPIHQARALAVLLRLRIGDTREIAAGADYLFEEEQRMLAAIYYEHPDFNREWTLL